MIALSAEQQVARIFFNALKQVIPTLKPSNIMVREHHYEPDEYDLRGVNQASDSTGLANSASISTEIDFVDIDIGFERAKTLKGILDGQTGILSSYNGGHISFKGSAEGLLQLLDIPSFELKVRNMLPPMER